MVQKDTDLSPSPVSSESPRFRDRDRLGGGMVHPSDLNTPVDVDGIGERHSAGVPSPPDDHPRGPRHRGRAKNRGRGKKPTGGHSLDPDENSRKGAVNGPSGGGRDSSGAGADKGVLRDFELIYRSNPAPNWPRKRHRKQPLAEKGATPVVVATVAPTAPVSVPSTAAGANGAASSVYAAAFGGHGGGAPVVGKGMYGGGAAANSMIALRPSRVVRASGVSSGGGGGGGGGDDDVITASPNKSPRSSDAATSSVAIAPPAGGHRGHHGGHHSGHGNHHHGSGHHYNRHDGAGSVSPGRGEPMGSAVSAPYISRSSVGHRSGGGAGSGVGGAAGGGGLQSHAPVHPHPGFHRAFSSQLPNVANDRAMRPRPPMVPSKEALT